MKTFVLLLLCITIITGCGSTNNNTNSKSIQSAQGSVKRDSRTPEKKFVEDKMDSLIKSTSSLVDLTWKTTVIESIDDYQFGLLNAESTVSDLELSKKQYENKIKEIEDFTIPENLEFNGSAKVYINGTLESLVTAIQERIKIIDYLIGVVNKGTINNEVIEEVEMKLIVANAYLESSANSYGKIYENLD